MPRMSVYVGRWSRETGEGDLIEKVPLARRPGGRVFRVSSLLCVHSLTHTLTLSLSHLLSSRSHSRSHCHSHFHPHNHVTFTLMSLSLTHTLTHSHTHIHYHYHSHSHLTNTHYSVPAPAPPPPPLHIMAVSARDAKQASERVGVRTGARPPPIMERNGPRAA